MNSPWTEHPAPATHRIAGHPWWRQALALAVLRRPADPLRPGNALHFLIAGLLWLGCGLLLDDWLVAPPREFSEWALTERSFPLLLALGGASLLASLLGRGAVTLGLASLLLLTLLPGTLLWIWVQARLETSAWVQWTPALYLALLGWQVVRWCAPGAVLSRRLGAALLAALLLIGSWQWVPDSPWWWSSEASAENEAASPKSTDSVPEQAGISAERLWQAQPQRLREALAQLAPQRPGEIDLYVLALAGDGSENVFRNEVAYVREIAEQRFGAAGRVLPLVNHPQTLGEVPIASVSNLRDALLGLAKVMDPAEDLLWLFLTTHGSEDHQLYLGLEPLPLDWLDPATLRQSLDAAGFDWRVIVISACYSGGFVDALRDERTLVITAARADRPSFGCGVQSEITWFGQAFLAEALNQTLDFGEAFRLARSSVREREREQGERPSYPQIALGQAIAPRLRSWQEHLPQAPEVRFSAGMPVASLELDKPR
jgi:hypothetical protein